MRIFKPKQSEQTTDKYDETKLSDNSDTKVFINKEVAKYFKDNDNNDCLVLESKAMLTVNTLVEAGIRSKKIFIPNPTESFDDIRSNHRNTFKLYLGEYIKQLSETKANKGKFSNAWLDYCCSINSVGDSNPKKDIVDLFKYGLLSDEAVLAYTFSQRDGQKAQVKYHSRYNAELHLQAVAQNFGYYCSKLRSSIQYKGGMFFDIFKLVKMPSKAKAIDYEETSPVEVFDIKSGKHKIVETRMPVQSNAGSNARRDDYERVVNSQFEGMTKNEIAIALYKVHFFDLNQSQKDRVRRRQGSRVR